MPPKIQTTKYADGMGVNMCLLLYISQHLSFHLAELEQRNLTTHLKFILNRIGSKFSSQSYNTLIATLAWLVYL